MKGLEPPRRKTQDPKSCAATKLRHIRLTPCFKTGLQRYTFFLLWHDFCHLKNISLSQIICQMCLPDK